MAGTHERPVHHCKIVAIRIKTGANAIDLAKRGKEPERLGKKASAVEEIEQSLCAGSDEAIAYRRRDDCACIDQDRKSTRLNSSHGYISYAVFCLKKKNIGPPPPLNSNRPE